MGERTYVFFLPPFFPMLTRLFFPTAILLQPQPPRWGLGAREVEWLAALHRGVATVAAAPLASAPPALRLRPRARSVGMEGRARGERD